MQYQEIWKKTWKKNHLGKNSRCFCWWFFVGVQKSFENKVISWSLTLEALRLPWFFAWKTQSSNDPPEVNLKIENPIQETCAALDHSPGGNSTFLWILDWLSFVLGKILSSAAACCFWKTFQSGCIWWDVTAINQSYARERHQVKLPLSRLKYSRRLNPCSSWWFRNPKQPPFVWKEPWILAGWSINWCRSSETSTVSFQTFYSIPQVYIICVFVAMSLLLTSIITRPHIPGPLTQVTLENTTFCPKRKQNRLPFHCQPFFRDVPSLFVWGMVTIDKGSSRWSPAPCLVRVAEKIQDMTDVPKQRKDGSPLGLHMNCTIFSNVLLCLSFLCCIFWIPCNTTYSLDQQIDSRKCFFCWKIQPWNEETYIQVVLI